MDPTANIRYPVSAYCLTMLTPTVKDTEFGEYLTAIEDDYRHAQETTRVRALSGGAKRDMEAAFQKIGKYFSTTGLSPEEIFVTWASNIIACGILLRDCLSTCPKYAYTESWKLLSEKMDFLSDKLMEIEPLADEKGMAQYLEIAI